MAYTTINKSTDYFNTKLYTGNGSTQSITGVGHAPDLVWLKERSQAEAHVLMDKIRGVTKRLRCDQTSAEDTLANSLTAFDTDGFSLGSAGEVNENSQTYASWNWKAGGAGSANTDGATNSTVSVNNTAGFSIVKWQGTSGNTTVGHGMNKAPTMMIIKNTEGGSSNWVVYHQTISPSKSIKLNLSDAKDSSNNYWQNTAPTNSLITLTGGTAANGNDDNMIAYCFTDIVGYQKAGSYIGRGSGGDNTFIYTGFKPSFIMIKNINANEDWLIYDNKREGYNETNDILRPNATTAEGALPFDILSNGFKVRGDNGKYGSATTFIYYAVGQSIVGTNNIPATAR
ncbi:hypothetical protein P105_gp43 [Pelagibacter phage HTVC105P]|nr:hypothetical protein P105_gp43 [Pelagibacter phage HTVC105P]